jgi:hypothetical protein
MSTLNTESTAIIAKELAQLGEVHLVGCGTAGSHLAIALLKAGLPARNLTIYDFDEVNAHNVSSQAYSNHHVGMSKTEALVDIYLSSILDKENYLLYRTGQDYAKPPTPIIEGKYENQILEGTVIIAVDTIPTRIKLLQHCVENPKVNHIISIGFPLITSVYNIYFEVVYANPSDYEFVNNLISKHQRVADNQNDADVVTKQLLAKMQACRMPNLGSIGLGAAAYTTILMAQLGNVMTLQMEQLTDPEINYSPIESTIKKITYVV